MKRVAIVVGIFVCLTVGFIVVQQQDADAQQVIAAQVTTAAQQLPVEPPAAETYKKCGFNSDCPYGKCKSGRCGSCGFNSDCKGWGKCKGGWCGNCGFSSDCKGFGKCSGGKCTKSPY